MRGLMMDFPLTLTALFRRAESQFPGNEIVWREADRSVQRRTYGSWAGRVRRLVTALAGLGIRPGDRVATLAWNHGPHYEVYFAAPISGAVLHTLNLRLSPEELAYVVNHAEDRVVFVDATLWPLWEKVAPLVHVEQVIVMGGPAPDGCLAYEALLEAHEPAQTLPALDENVAASMCYTTGTTGHPKGVVYSHRALVLHTFGLVMPDVLNISERDVMLPIVPMFHVNAWGFPFAAAMTGCRLVLPGPFLDAESLLQLIESEQVTFAGGVPTVAMGMLQALDAGPARRLASFHTMAVGGSAPPRAMMQAFKERHGITILQAWGLTETAPLATVSRLPPTLDQTSDAEKLQVLGRQGRAVPFVELRVATPEGLAPHDGQTMGEIEVRGPWVAASYYNMPEGADRFTADGWFKTGDIATIDASGIVEIQDRAKDLIKSGGEWISSVALENALMGHPAIAEAAVIAVAHDRWMERPLAAVVLRKGMTATADELRAFLETQFPKFWLPDAFVFIDAIPRTAAGKFLKRSLRDRFKDWPTR